MTGLKQEFYRLSEKHNEKSIQKSIFFTDAFLRQQNLKIYFLKGNISKEEFTKVVGDKMNPNDLALIINKCDSNKDNQINYNEFVEIMTYGDKKSKWCCC